MPAKNAVVDPFHDEIRSSSSFSACDQRQVTISNDSIPTIKRASGTRWDNVLYEQPKLVSHVARTHEHDQTISSYWFDARFRWGHYGKVGRGKLKKSCSVFILLVRGLAHTESQARAFKHEFKRCQPLCLARQLSSNVAK